MIKQKDTDIVIEKTINGSDGTIRKFTIVPSKNLFRYNGTASHCEEDFDEIISEIKNGRINRDY